MAVRTKEEVLDNAKEAYVEALQNRVRELHEQRSAIDAELAATLLALDAIEEVV